MSGYQLATVLLVAVAAIVAACLCVLIAERLSARRSGRRWTTKLSSIWWLKLGALLLAGFLAYAPISAGMASAARSATAQPVIVSKQAIEWSAGWHGSATLSGVSVRYSFTADGRTYSGEARRQWSLDDVTTSKVCYDPGDPAGSHSLEQAGYSCGTFDLHTSDR